MSKPTAFVGPVGSLVPFLGPSSESISADRKVSFSDTLGRRKAFVGRSSPREWSCELNARYPSEVAGLRWLAAFGQPPFVWYPADAVFGNILEPAVAGLVPGTHSGLEGPMVEVEPDVWVKSAVRDGGTGLSIPLRSGSLDPVPVIPGKPVTVSAWLRGASCGIDMVWRNASGTSIGSSAGPSSSRSSLTRVSRILTAPAGAAQVSITFRAEQVAGPAVSLTDKLASYSPGKGCKRAVVHGLSEALILVTRSASLSSFSFTVSEVG